MRALIPIISQSATITLFVLSMMLIIEYFNVFSRGIWNNNLKNSTWKQILLSALLGVIPGCLGAYTAVSLYIHNVIGTAALATAMIATSGDEAFFMFSIVPDTATVLTIVIFLIAIASGFIVSIFIKKDDKIINYSDKHLEVHNEKANCFCFKPKDIIANFKNITLLRSILILILLAALGFIIYATGGDADHIDFLTMPNLKNADPEWIRITFIIVISISLLMVFTVNDHFLSDHIKEHIIKKHLVRIFLWTFFTLLILHVLGEFVNIDKLIGNNIFIVLLVAVLVGIIPESGPHLIFLLLFAAGSLPFSILLANSIVQDGHGSLPLLAETRKGFFIIKAINIAVGLIVGLIGIFAGI